MDIQLVQHGIRILRIQVRHNHKGYERANLAQTRCEYDDLKNLTHFLQEVVHAWALDYVDVVPVVLDFNRHNVVRLLNRLDRKVRH
jgi:hypothetical protein